MLIDIITIFPGMFKPVINESIIKRAQVKGLAKIRIHDLRDYSDDRHKKIDAPSYGGGGMVFKAKPLFEAVEAISNSKNSKVVLFSPKGRKLTQESVKKFLDCEQIICLAPRYEGLDERVREHLVDEEISIGDYVTSGGELPAMVFIDSLMRLIPGVVSDKESIVNESFENNSLDYPHYTRPEDFRGMKVPEVLLSGDHKKITQWRKEKALEITRKRRPDLLNGGR